MYERTKQDNKWKTMQNNSVCCYYHHLRKDNLEYIQALKEQLIIEIEGVKIRAVHGSPDCITELIYFDTPRMEEIFNNLQEDVLVYGHNHKVAQYQVRYGKTIVQVGVLGIHNNEIGKAQYTILNCENGQVYVQPRTLEYNVEKLKEKIIQVGGVYKEARIWQNLNFLTILKGKDVRKDFCRQAKEKMLLKYGEKYPNPLGSHFESFDDDIYQEVAKKFEPYFLL